MPCGVEVARPYAEDADERPVWVSGLEIADGVVVAIRSILNPDKLEHLRGR